MENGKLKVGIQSLLGYLPAIVIKNILDGEIDSKRLPSYYKINTVSLFADISGFTKLSESFAKKGRIGPEFLAFSLNRYMEQLINIIGKNGGDIFKFAGDAILVIWPQTGKIEESCVRAIQCALDIQGKLNNVEISPNKRLSVKIGIGVGECMVLVVGGQFARCEYLCVGEALAEACLSETKATEGGQTICSEKVKNYINNYFQFEEAVGGDDHGHGHDEDEGKFYRILKMTGNRVQTKADAYLMRTQFSNEKLRDRLPILKSFVPAAVVKYLDLEKESWCKEIRMLGIMFLNLKVDLSQTRTDEGIQRIQQIVKTVQRCVYRTRGGLNKFLMDDKGSVMLICWGLPPLSAHDDHMRGVFTGLTLISELRKFGCGAYMGVTTGSCFTGVCGTIGGRREYSLLGEIVNLSARHMQKAIYYAKDISKESGQKVDYMMLIDERTKDLIQNKIFSTYCCKGELKGFQGEFDFWKPLEDNKANYNYTLSLFPDIRTHNYNIPIYNLPPAYKKEPMFYLKRSLYMIGRRRELESCRTRMNRLLKIIPAIYSNPNKEENHKYNEVLLIRGTLGSGKSLFIRKFLYEFIEYKDFKQMNQKLPFIFVSFQSPVTNFDPMNAWNPILKQIYQILVKELKLVKQQETIKMGDNIKVNCDAIGKILFESYSYMAIKFIEEILDTSLSRHFDVPTNPSFSIFMKVQELPERDPFFKAQNFEGVHKFVIKFFIKIIKKYQELVLSQVKSPLIFVLEDCHIIDDISYEMIKRLRNKLQGLCIICSYQDPMTQVVQNYEDKITKHIEAFNFETIYLMDSITDMQEAHELIKHHVEEDLRVEVINEKLLNIVLTKAFKGNPLFIMDIIESLVKSKKCYVDNKQLLPSKELIQMEEDNDWSGFNIPIRIEKILGNIIDSLDTKDIILLKHASVIGNLFDIDKLKDINPFVSVTLDDLYAIIMNLENNGIIEILYDLNPKQLVCKFGIPFLREVCYQRMLIEQKNDIHLSVAKLLQNTKFSYIPHHKEVVMLQKHLKITEKSIINYMEEDDDAQQKKVTVEALNLNNLKIFQVKDICGRLKAIDLRLEEGYDIGKNIPKIKAGEVNKKSDKNITWENRFLVISNTKFFYYYTENDYVGNKMPLGSFDLKNLYIAQLLPDFSVGGHKNVFMIHVSSWYKKDEVQGSRKYYFSEKTKEQAYNWVITLNFLRVKAIYNDFTAIFGTINLPLRHEVKKKKKSMKKKFSTAFNNVKSGKSFSNYYNFYARKSVQKNIDNNNNRSTMMMKRLSHFNSIGGNENFNEENEHDKKVGRLKEGIEMVFKFGFICLLGQVQDVVFNIESVGSSDEKTLRIPKSLKFLTEGFNLEKKNSFSLTLNTSANNTSGLYDNLSPTKSRANTNIRDVKEIKEMENDDENDNSINTNKNKFDEKLVTEEEKHKIDANADEQKIELKNDPTNTTIDNVNIISHKLRNLDVSASDLDEILLENFNDNEARLK